MKSSTELILNRPLRKRVPITTDGMPVRAKKKKSRLYIDAEYYDNGYARAFPHSTTNIYGALARRANFEKQSCYPSYDDLGRLTGIKNRSTISESLYILERYDIISASHPTGRITNDFVLLDCAQWANPNSLSIETVRKEFKEKKSVAKIDSKQSQKQIPNSYTSDTQNDISKSDNEIKNDKEEVDQSESVVTQLESSESLELVDRLSSAVKFSLKKESPRDVARAVNILKDRGKEVSRLLSSEIKSEIERLNGNEPRPP